MIPKILRPVRLGAFAAAVLIVLTGCGGGDSSSSNSDDGGGGGVPAAPANLLARPMGTTSTQVEWTAVSGATSYNIYHATTSGVDVDTASVEMGATSPFTFLGQSTGETRYYVVTAQNGSGESTASEEGCATPNDLSSTTIPNIVCIFSDEWGGTQTISAATWNDGFGLFHVETVNNSGQFLTAQNDSENDFNANLWSRFDWTYYLGDLYYCQIIYNGADEAAALAGDSDDSNPSAGGCNGFSWTNMTP